MSEPETVDNVVLSRLSPWDEDRIRKLHKGDQTGGHGPGSLEDYVKLTNQGEHPAHPEAVFNIFIKRNCPRNSHGHLLDCDDNDGEYVRRAIRAALVSAYNQGEEQTRRRIRKKLGL